MSSPRRRLSLALPGLVLIAAALPTAADSAGVGGGGSGVSFGQGRLNGDQVSLLVNPKLTRLYQITLSCPSRVGQSVDSYSSKGLTISDRRVSRRITLYNQHFSPTIDAVTHPAPVSGYLKAQWLSATGPVRGSLSVKDCHNGRPVPLNAHLGFTVQSPF